MKFIYVASPYAGNREKNVAFAKKACEWVRSQGHVFFAPHLFYPQFLEDTQEKQRTEAINMALVILNHSDELWVFGEIISAGMKQEIEFAQVKGIPIRLISTAEMESMECKENQSPPDNLPPWESWIC